MIHKMHSGITCARVACTAASALTLINERAHAQLCNQTGKVFPADGKYRDFFGYSIAIDDGIIAGGAPGVDLNGEDSGAAYLFDVETGEELFRFIPGDGEAGDEFGHRIDIDNGLVVIGAIDDEDNGYRTSSAYVYDAWSGLEIAKLLPDDGEDIEGFGQSVAISDGIVVVGATFAENSVIHWGRAYLYDALSGEQLGVLIPDDLARGDDFAESVAIDGRLVVVGAQGDDDNGSTSGSAYVFDATTGRQLAKLTATDGAEGEEFGTAVAIADGLVAIGAPRDDDRGNFTGSIYLFDASTGRQLGKVTAPDGQPRDSFGNAMDVRDGYIVGTAVGDDDIVGGGSAYVFSATTGEFLAKLLPDGGFSRFGFAHNIATADGIVIMGDSESSDVNTQSGSMFLFDAECGDICLRLDAENVMAGEDATFTITGGTPGSRVLTVFGGRPGQTVFKEVQGYCANFAIKYVRPSRVIGGFDRVFDANGEVSFESHIPIESRGMRAFFQSAEHGTCPEKCLSNRIKVIIP